jgi:hypothetical protein
VLDTWGYKRTFFFFFHWRYSPLWALACRTMSLHFVLSITNSLHLLTPNTWRSLSTSSFHSFLGLPLRFVFSSYWMKIFLGILSSIFSRWPNLLILCPFIHFTIFFSLVFSSSSRFVLLFLSRFIYSGPYILLNINAHSEYVIIMTFPLKQWLHKRPWMLGYTHIACSVRIVSRGTLS